MSYKDVLGIKDEKADYVFDKYIDNHFLERGFYYDTMSPRFVVGYGYYYISHDRPCLKFVTESRDGGTLRVFINDLDALVEEQTNYRSYANSNYVSLAHDNGSVAEIESVLDDLLEGYRNEN